MHKKPLESTGVWGLRENRNSPCKISGSLFAPQGLTCVLPFVIPSETEGSFRYQRPQIPRLHVIPLGMTAILHFAFCIPPLFCHSEPVRKLVWESPSKVLQGMGDSHGRSASSE